MLSCRLRPLPLLALAFALVVAGLPGVSAAQTSVAQTNQPRRDPRFGAVQAINAPEAAARAGVAWERIIFPWAQIQPDGPDQMQPGYYTDAQIDAQAARGVELVGVVLYTPGWAATDPSKGARAVPKGLDKSITDRDNTWAQFMGKLAARYRGKVDTWIVWNEPDLLDGETKESWTWAGSVEDFWNLQKNAYLAVKRANPRAKVLTSGYSYWHTKEAGLEPFLKRLLEIASKDRSSRDNDWYFDGVPVHPYANPLNSFAKPEIYRRIMAEHGLNKEIWNLESNAVPWDDPAGLLPREPWRVTMDQQASYVVQAFALGLAAGVDRMSVYKMRDEFPENGQNFGLVREDGTTRPAYTAFQTAINYFAGAKKATYTWNGSPNPPGDREIRAILDSRNDRYQFVWPGQVSQVALERDNQRVTVVWNVTPKPVVGLVAAAASRATLVDAYGNTSQIAPTDGWYQLYLDGARSNTEPRDSSLLLVGGRPWLIVEDLGSGAPASQPPRTADALYFQESGFAVANGEFAEYFQGRGGKDTFGLPISREFDLQGMRTQIFQRQVMQLRPDGKVATLNLLDEGLMPYTALNGSIVPGPDAGLRAQAPSPSDPAYADKVIAFVQQHAPDTWQGRRVNFGQTFFNTIRCEGAGAASCSPGVQALLNFEFWGLPLSPPAADPANGDFVYQRFQRGIMHYDARCDCTRGLLLGEHFKAIVTGQNLAADLDEQAKSSPYYRQYDQTRVQGMSRPNDLPRSNFKDAAERLP